MKASLDVANAVEMCKAATEQQMHIAQQKHSTAVMSCAVLMTHHEAQHETTVVFSRLVLLSMLLCSSK